MSISCCDGPDLVVVVLDRDAHVLERADRVAADRRRGVHRRLREVAALVERLRALVVLEEEVLRLGADVERVEAHRLHPLDRAPQDVARVAVVALAVGRDDVADHPARLAVGEDPERRRIGDRDHVGLLDRVEAGDRRAVEAHAVVERAFDLARRDREALQVPLEVREPEQHVLDPALLDLLQHVLPGTGIRRRPVLALDLRHHFLLARRASSLPTKGRREPALRRPTVLPDATASPRAQPARSRGRTRTWCRSSGHRGRSPTSRGSPRRRAA